MTAVLADTHFYEPAKGHRLPHCPLKAIVAPRPIGWISSVDAKGNVNLAPYSFFNMVCDAPPILYFASKGWKDSTANIEATGEFVASLVNRPLAEAMNITSAAVPHGEDEMRLAGLTAAPSRLVKPPRVAAAPTAFECKSLGISEVKDLDGKGTDFYMVLGQVVGVHIDPAYLHDGIFDTAAARTVARCGYRGYYTEVSGMFEMIRPSEASALRKG